MMITLIFIQQGKAHKMMIELGHMDKNHRTDEALDKKQLMTCGFGGCYFTKKSNFRTH